MRNVSREVARIQGSVGGGGGVRNVSRGATRIQGGEG